MSEDELLNSIINKLNDLNEKILAQTVKFFVGKSKPEMKEALIEFDTSIMKNLMIDVFQDMEEYEVCQAFKEVLEERYADPLKRRAYAEMKVKVVMDGIEFLRNVTGNGIEIETWDSLRTELEDKAVNEVFLELYPIRVMIKSEMERFYQRYISGAEIFTEIEMHGFPGTGLTGFEGKINNAYTDSNFHIEINGESLKITFVDEKEINWELNYFKYELIEESAFN